MAKKKAGSKAKAKKEPKKVSKELKEDIQDAVSGEDKPSKALRTSKIPVTHWEKDPIKDEPEEELTEKPKKEPKKKTVKTEVVEEKDIDEADPGTVEVDTNEAEEADSETVEADTEETENSLAEEAEDTVESEVGPKAEVDEKPDDEDDSAVEEDEVKDDDSEENEDEDHEWHKLDEEKPAVFGDEQWSASGSEEDDEHPDWDDEKWRQANADEEEVESPERDEKKQQQAKSEDEEEAEHPDWDDEKYKHSTESEKEAVVESSEQDVTDLDLDIGKSEKTDLETEPEPSEEKSEQTTEESAAREISDEDLIIASSKAYSKAKDTAAATDADDPDQQSASSVALNGRKDTEIRGRFNPKRLASKFVNWWKKAKIRNSAIAMASALLLVFVSVPAPRYAMLNTVGVRATASVKVLDSDTQLPLKLVDVSLAGLTTQTSTTGLATFDNVKLGTHLLTITKSAYDKHTVSVTVGLGDNQFDAIELDSIGTSFEFVITDWLTGDPLPEAEVTYDQNSAFVDDQGLANLSTPTVNEATITVTASAPGYSDQEIEVDTTSTEIIPVGMVVEKEHLFVSKRNGNYDIYKIAADGSNEELILAGTGSEKNAMRFDVSPSGERAVLVATRDKNIKNDDGFVLSGIYLINLKTGKLTKIDSSERIDLIGWIGETVIYVKVQAGASGQNPERHRLVSLNTANGMVNQIAASNFFNDVLVAKDYVFYAPSDAYKQNPKPYLFRSNADGSKIDTVFEKVVWTVIRSDIDEISFDSDQTWYRGEIDRVFNVELDTRPASFVSRLYTDSPSGEVSARVEIRDGKGALIIANFETGAEETLISQGGLRNPITWLSDSHIIFRVVTSDETADYVISAEGGDPVKLTDVTDVSGADRWYYFY